MNKEIIKRNILNVVNQPCIASPWDKNCKEIKINGLSKDGTHIMVTTKPEDSSTEITLEGDFVEYILQELPEKYRKHLVTIEHDTWISYSYVPVFDSDTQAEWDKELNNYLDLKQAWCDEHGCE